MNIEIDDNLEEIRDYESRMRESEGKDTNKSNKKVRFHYEQQNLLRNENKAGNSGERIENEEALEKEEMEILE